MTEERAPTAVTGVVNAVFYVSLSVVVYQVTQHWWAIPIALVAALLLHLLTTLLPLSLILFPLGLLWFLASVLRAVGIYSDIPLIADTTAGANPWAMSIACASFTLYHALHGLRDELQACVFFGISGFFLLRTVNIAYLACALPQWWLLLGALLFAIGGLLVAFAAHSVTELASPAGSSSHGQAAAQGAGMLLAGVLFLWLFTLTAHAPVWTYLSVERLWLRKEPIQSVEHPEACRADGTGSVPSVTPAPPMKEDAEQSKD